MDKFFHAQAQHSGLYLHSFDEDSVTLGKTPLSWSLSEIRAAEAAGCCNFNISPASLLEGSDG